MNNGSIVLRIELLPNRSLKIDGPINDKVLAYGLLEAAKDAIRDYVAKNSSMITIPDVKVGGLG